MDRHASRVAAYYDAETGPFYRRLWDGDDLHLGLFEAPAEPLPTTLTRMTRAIVEPAGPRPGDRVVDAGCGVGGAARFLAREYGCRVVGLNISPVQLDEARRLTGDDRVTFERADCSAALPLDDASVDLLVSVESACHYERRPRFVAEVARVLRGGGRLALSDWLAGEQDDAGARQARADLVEAWCLRPLETLRSWRELAEDAGLEVLETQDFGEAIRPNGSLMLTSALGLRLEAASAGWTDRARRWLAMYESLGRGILTGAVTVGRLLARRP